MVLKILYSFLFQSRKTKPSLPAFFMFLLILSSIALAQDISLDIEGSCKEYNVTLIASGFSEGCYDVKIDITTPSGRVGRIYDPREGWKSSIYYADEAVCIEEANASVDRIFAMKADTQYNQLYFQPKLRAGSKIWEGNYTEFRQSCPEEPEYNIYFFFLVVLIVILVLLTAVTLYVKVWK